MKVQMTTKEYLTDPSMCPFCHSLDVAWSIDENIDGSSIWKENKCDCCGKHWQDVYDLTSYEEVDI